MICKTTLDRLGKAAFNALSDEDKKKYVTASKVMTIVSDIINERGKGLNIGSRVGVMLVDVGLEVGKEAVIYLAKTLGGENITDLAGAISAIANYINSGLNKLIDQLKHEIAAKLAVLFGVNENPGILGAIMEWVFKAIVKPTLA